MTLLVFAIRVYFVQNRNGRYFETVVLEELWRVSRFGVELDRLKQIPLSQHDIIEIIQNQEHVEVFVLQLFTQVDGLQCKHVNTNIRGHLALGYTESDSIIASGCELLGLFDAWVYVNCEIFRTICELFCNWLAYLWLLTAFAPCEGNHVSVVQVVTNVQNRRGRL